MLLNTTTVWLVCETATTLPILVWTNRKFSLVALRRADPQQLTPTSARSGRLKLLKGSISSAQLNTDCCCFVQSSPYDKLHLAFSRPTQMVRVTNWCLDYGQPTHWCHKKRLIPLRWVSLFVCIPTTAVANATMGKKLIKAQLRIRSNWHKMCNPMKGIIDINLVFLK